MTSHFARHALAGMIAVSAATLAIAADTDTAPRSYQIPAGPLNAAIARFSAESGLYVAVDGALSAGKTSPGLQGTLAPQEALNRLLAGSGLDALSQGSGRYISTSAAHGPTASPCSAAHRAPASTSTATTASTWRRR